MLDANDSQGCFSAWATSFTELSEGVIAMGSKISRRAQAGGKVLLHTVLVFVGRQWLLLR